MPGTASRAAERTASLEAEGWFSEEARIRAQNAPADGHPVLSGTIAVLTDHEHLSAMCMELIESGTVDPEDPAAGYKTLVLLAIAMRTLRLISAGTVLNPRSPIHLRMVAALGLDAIENPGKAKT